jgi:hypothetical protein
MTGDRPSSPLLFTPFLPAGVRQVHDLPAVRPLDQVERVYAAMAEPVTPIEPICASAAGDPLAGGSAARSYHVRCQAHNHKFH